MRGASDILRETAGQNGGQVGAVPRTGGTFRGGPLHIVFWCLYWVPLYIYMETTRWAVFKARARA